jgi:voltage-gated potassium channel
MLLRIFDLAVVVILGIDFVVSCHDHLASNGDGRHLIFIVLHQIICPLVVRLYNVMSYIDGSELIILASMSAVTILFGGFAICITEAGHPDASINNIADAMWWSIETITTVAYGEYSPITYAGRVIASVMMFAAIAFLWTLDGSRFVAKRFTKKVGESSSSNNNNLLLSTSVVDETKTMIKKKLMILRI